MVNSSIAYAQIGENAKAEDPRWNVPVGLTVTKTTKIDSVPVKFQLGIEYSVVSQDTYGQVAQIKLNIIPVINSLVKDPIFGS
jgi:hypothetical protein